MKGLLLGENRAMLSSSSSSTLANLGGCRVQNDTRRKQGGRKPSLQAKAIEDNGIFKPRQSPSSSSSFSTSTSQAQHDTVTETCTDEQSEEGVELVFPSLDFNLEDQASGEQALQIQIMMPDNTATTPHRSSTEAARTHESHQEEDDNSLIIQRRQHEEEEDPTMFSSQHDNSFFRALALNLPSPSFERLLFGNTSPLRNNSAMTSDNTTHVKPTDSADERSCAMTQTSRSRSFSSSSTSLEGEDLGAFQALHEMIFRYEQEQQNYTSMSGETDDDNDGDNEFNAGQSYPDSGTRSESYEDDTTSASPSNDEASSTFQSHTEEEGETDSSFLEEDQGAEQGASISSSKDSTSLGSTNSQSDPMASLFDQALQLAMGRYNKDLRTTRTPQQPQHKDEKRFEKVVTPKILKEQMLSKLPPTLGNSCHSQLPTSTEKAPSFVEQLESFHVFISKDFEMKDSLSMESSGSQVFTTKSGVDTVDDEFLALQAMIAQYENAQPCEFNEEEGEDGNDMGAKEVDSAVVECTTNSTDIDGATTSFLLFNNTALRCSIDPFYRKEPVLEPCSSNDSSLMSMLLSSPEKDNDADEILFQPTHSSTISYEEEEKRLIGLQALIAKYEKEQKQQQQRQEEESNDDPAAFCRDDVSSHSGEANSSACCQQIQAPHSGPVSAIGEDEKAQSCNLTSHELSHTAQYVPNIMTQEQFSVLDPEVNECHVKNERCALQGNVSEWNTVDPSESDSDEQFEQTQKKHARSHEDTCQSDSHRLLSTEKDQSSLIEEQTRAKFGACSHQANYAQPEPSNSYDDANYFHSDGIVESPTDEEEAFLALQTMIAAYEAQQQEEQEEEGDEVQVHQLGMENCSFDLTPSTLSGDTNECAVAFKEQQGQVEHAGISAGKTDDVEPAPESEADSKYEELLALHAMIAKYEAEHRERDDEQLDDESSTTGFQRSIFPSEFTEQIHATGCENRWKASDIPETSETAMACLEVPGANEETERKTAEDLLIETISSAVHEVHGLTSTIQEDDEQRGVSSSFFRKDDTQLQKVLELCDPSAAVAETIFETFCSCQEAEQGGGLARLGTDAAPNDSAPGFQSTEKAKDSADEFEPVLQHELQPASELANREETEHLEAISSTGCEKDNEEPSKYASETAALPTKPCAAVKELPRPLIEEETGKSMPSQAAAEYEEGSTVSGSFPDNIVQKEQVEKKKNTYYCVDNCSRSSRVHRDEQENPALQVSALSVQEKSLMLVRELKHIQLFGPNMFHRIEDKIDSWRHHEAQRKPGAYQQNQTRGYLGMKPSKEHRDNEEGSAANLAIQNVAGFPPLEKPRPKNLIRELQYVQTQGSYIFDSINDKVKSWQREQSVREFKSNDANDEGGSASMKENGQKDALVHSSDSDGLEALADITKSHEPNSENTESTHSCSSTSGKSLTIVSDDAMEEKSFTKGVVVSSKDHSLPTLSDTISSPLSCQYSDSFFNWDVPAEAAAAIDKVLETAADDTPDRSCLGNADDTITVEVTVHSVLESIASDDEEWTVMESMKDETEVYEFFDFDSLDAKDDAEEYGVVGHGVSDSLSVFSELTIPTVTSGPIHESPAAPAAALRPTSPLARIKTSTPGEFQPSTRRLRRVPPSPKQAPAQRRLPFQQVKLRRVQSNPTGLPQMRQAALLLMIRKQLRPVDIANQNEPTENDTRTLRRCYSDKPVHANDLDIEHLHESGRRPFPRRKTPYLGSDSRCILDFSWDELDELHDTESKSYDDEISDVTCPQVEIANKVSRMEDQLLAPGSSPPSPPSPPPGAKQISKTDNFYESVSVSFLAPSIRDHTIVQVMDEALRILKSGGILNVLDMNGNAIERIKQLDKYRSLGFQKATTKDQERHEKNTLSILEKSGLKTKFDVADPRIAHWTGVKPKS